MKRRNFIHLGISGMGTGFLIPDLALAKMIKKIWRMAFLYQKNPRVDGVKR